MKSKRSRALLVEVCPVTPHFQTTIELAYKFIAAGYDVFYLPAFMILDQLEFFQHPLPKYGTRIDGWFNLAKRFLPKNTKLVRPEGFRSTKVFNTPSLEVLASFPTADFNRNSEEHQRTLSVLASVSQYSKRSKIDWHDETSYRLFKKYLATSHLLEELTTLTINATNASVLCSFNGRTATTFPIALAGRRCNVKTIQHDRSLSNFLEYHIFDHCPFSFAERVRSILGFTEKLTITKLQLEAGVFFEDLRYGRRKGWLNFVSNSAERAKFDLPEDFSVFYTSSADEFIFNPYQSLNVMFSDQQQAIIHLDKIFSRLSKRLIVRIHPNTGNKNPTEVQAFLDLIPQLNATTIIPPEAKGFNSYLLLDRAQSVLHYGSTIGLESVYYGKPTASLAHCLGSNAACYTKINNEAELEEFIACPRVVESDFPMRYAYWLQHAGIPFRHFKPDGLWSGDFD